MQTGSQLGGRRWHDRRGWNVWLRRHRKGGLPERGGRQHIGAHGIRRGLKRGVARAAQQQLLPPGIELPATDAVLARHRCQSASNFDRVSASKIDRGGRRIGGPWSVPAEATGRDDGLEVGEVEVADCLQCFGGRAVQQIGR